MLKYVLWIRKIRDIKSSIRGSVRNSIDKWEQYKKSKHTREIAIKLIAEDLMRYTVLVNPIKLFIYIDDNGFSTLNFDNRYLKRNKTKRIFKEHYPLDLDFQIEIIDYIKKTNLFIVKEKVDSRKAHLGYVKTIEIDFVRRG